MKQFSLVTAVIVLSLLLTAGVPAKLSLKNTGDISGSVQYDQKNNLGILDLSNTFPEGFHDNSFGSQNQYYCVAEGWAADPDDRDIDLNVRVFSDDVQVAETVAGNFRPDLDEAGVCPGGTCSFGIDLWSLISHDVDHSISIQAQDAQTGEWIDLPNTPMILNCSESNVLPIGSHDGLSGFQNQYSCMVYGWATDPNDRDVDHTVRIFSDGVEVADTLASDFRPDLDDAGQCPGGTCSFGIDLWSLISHDIDHSISIQAQDAETGEWVDLGDTPKTLNCVEPHPQTFIVNTTTDAGDANWGNGVCETSTPSECTLRAAIEESNANPGTDSINFNIPGAGPYTISPSFGFDYINDPVIIDGTTQPGFAGTPIIELDGSNAGPDAYGIVIFAGSSTVRGLVINRFALTGIDLDVNGGNVIQGNYIGTDVTGTLDRGNGVNGVAISQGSSSNMIGGTTAEGRNIISGNGEFGIIIVDAGSIGNLIEGNYIGTDVTGTLDLGNTSPGVVIGALASDNVVGGTAPGAGNLISGNDSAGVHIDTLGSTGNRIEGNYIGTDVTGTVALGNAVEGVFIGDGASSTVVGGSATGARNVISANGGPGVIIAGADTTGNSVRGNFIGTDVTGTLNLGNSFAGVLLTSDAGTGNVITSNSIRANGGLGIDLGEDDVTANDLFDWDGGPNNLQNFATIAAAKSNGATMKVNLKLSSTPNTTFRIELFSADACDPSGYGEGNTFLGFVDATTNAGGQATVTVTLGMSLPVGSFVTATATDPNGNTSEFSKCGMVSQAH